MESSSLRIRPRLDNAFRNDGHRSMACLEARWIQVRQDSANVVRGATCAQRCLVVGLLPFSPTRLGLRGDRNSMACDLGNNNLFLQMPSDRWLVDGPLFGVG